MVDALRNDNWIRDVLHDITPTLLLEHTTHALDSDRRGYF
jgi:hypothetical protein